jgi:hypothetical protein
MGRQEVDLKRKKEGRNVAKSRGLYANINRRKKKGISRSRKKSTISAKAYLFMKSGFKKKKKGKRRGKKKK